MVFISDFIATFDYLRNIDNFFVFTKLNFFISKSFWFIKLIFFLFFIQVCLMELYSLLLDCISSNGLRIIPNRWCKGTSICKLLFRYLNSLSGLCSPFHLLKIKLNLILSNLHFFIHKLIIFINLFQIIISTIII